MKEFLRNNGKIILTILSIALMFVFALPASTPQSNDEARGVKVGTLDGSSVTAGTLEVRRYELNLLRQLGLLPRPPYASRAYPLTSDLLQQVEEERQDIYWLMLTTQAAKYSHAYISITDAMNLINPPGEPELDVRGVIQANKLSDPDFLAIIQQIDRVESYLRYLTSIPVPVTQLELMSDRFSRSVEVAVAPIDATTGWQDLPAPTDAQIDTHFTAYKGQLPTPIRPFPRKLSDGQYNYEVSRTPEGVIGKITTRTGTVMFEGPVDRKALESGKLSQSFAQNLVALASPAPQPAEVSGHHFPFGYKFPDRVRVEWLVLKKADIRARLPVTEEDQTKAFLYVRENPTVVRARIAATRPAPATSTAPATAPATTSAPATSVAATAPSTAPATQSVMDTLPTDPAALYRLAQNMLIDEQIDARLPEAMQRMINQLTTRAQPAKNASDGTLIDYKAIATAASTAPEFFGYKPEYGTSEVLRDLSELRELPGIGDSFATVSQQQVPFHLLALGVKEIVTLEKTNFLARLNLRQGAEGPPLHDAAGNIYLYRVVEAVKSHDPAINDVIRPGLTVRQQVINDLKKQKAYETQLAAVKEAIAKGADITGIATQFKAPVYKPAAFSQIDADRQVLPLEVASMRGLAEKAFTLKSGAAIEILDGDADLSINAVSLLKVNESTGLDFAGLRNEFLAMPDPEVGQYMRRPIMPRSDFEMPREMPYYGPGPFIRQYMDFDTLAKRVKYVSLDEPQTKPAK